MQVKLPKWVHSVPAWTLGPRASNPKFGGGVILAGVPEVDKRLIGIKRLSRKMGLRGEEELRSSGHILHEVKTGIPGYARYNAPGAISFRDLRAGIRAGKFPRWVAMTAPQFGFKGAERGGMISRMQADRDMAKVLHIEAITNSQELAAEGLGAGVNIWWPAWTSRRVGDPANPPMEFQEAWDVMLAFWVDVLRFTGGMMWLEWKPGDPGIDYLMTLELAIKFCNAVNEALGRIAMILNNEFAHLLIAGTCVADGVRRTVEAGLFEIFFHGNSGQMLPASIEDLLARGVKWGDVPILTDWDWVLGADGNGVDEGSETWQDQQEAIGIMDRAGQGVVYCEHDVNPLGLDPFVVLECSVHNGMRMLELERARAAGPQVEARAAAPGPKVPPDTD